jgi:transposase
MQDSGHTPDWPGQVVERVMSNGKRIFSTAFKAWLVEQAGKSGTSVAGLAMRFGVNANQLQRWIRLEHLREHGGEERTILPVVLAQTPQLSEVPSAVPRAPIEIEIAGAVVRVPAGADAQQLRIVLQALRA